MHHSFTIMTFQNFRILGQKAKDSIIHTSKKRKDEFKNLILHKTCYTTYIRLCIHEAVKTRKHYKSVMRDSLKKAKKFNFDKACFLCKKPSRNTKKQSYVNSIDSIECMYKELNNRVLGNAESLFSVPLSNMKENFKNLLKLFINKLPIKDVCVLEI